MTHASDEPVLRDVEVEVGHDAEDSHAQVGDRQVHQEEVDVIPHLAVAQDDKYHQQIACTTSGYTREMDRTHGCCRWRIISRISTAGMSPKVPLPGDPCTRLICGSMGLHKCISQTANVCDDDVISVPAGFRRHFVGKAPVNFFYHCDIDKIRFVGKLVIIQTFS